MLNPALPSASPLLPPLMPDIPKERRPLVPPGTPGRRLKHGLYSEAAVAPGEDPAAFDAMLQEFLVSERVTHPADRMLAERAVRAHWHSLRVWALEAGVYKRLQAEQPGAEGEEAHVTLARCFMADCKEGRTLDKLNMHQARLGNAFLRALKELRLRQKLRAQGLLLEPDLLASPSFDGESAEIAESSAAPAPAASGGTEGSEAAPEARDAEPLQPQRFRPLREQARDWNEIGSSEIAESAALGASRMPLDRVPMASD